MPFGPLRFVGCPKNGKTFFRKTQMRVLGTSAQTGAPNGAFLAPNGAFWRLEILAADNGLNMPTPYMVSRLTF
jgi:hypothetical protein